LACKAVLAKFTNISYAATNPEEYDPPAPLDDGLSYGLQWDPIAIIWSFTTAVHYLNIIMELQSNIYLQSLKKLSQCFAILERVTWNKSNKLSNIVKIMYGILHHLGFRKYPGSCDLDQK